MAHGGTLCLGFVSDASFREPNNHFCVRVQAPWVHHFSMYGYLGKPGRIIHMTHVCWKYMAAKRQMNAAKSNRLLAVSEQHRPPSSDFPDGMWPWALRTVCQHQEKQDLHNGISSKTKRQQKTFLKKYIQTPTIHTKPGNRNYQTDSNWLAEFRAKASGHPSRAAGDPYQQLLIEAWNPSGTHQCVILNWTLRTRPSSHVPGVAGPSSLDLKDLVGRTSRVSWSCCADTLLKKLRHVEATVILKS